LTELAISLQADSDSEGENNPGALTDDEIEAIIEKLPRLTEADLERCGHHDSSCPICLNTFLASIAEEEMAYVMDSPAQPVEDLGVTRLADTCEHVFCRKELSASLVQ
jgi:bacterioferritin-associated ferredoxin